MGARHAIDTATLARRIDVSAVQAYHARSDIEELAAAARTFGFGAAHALPAWVGELKSLLAGSHTAVGSPVGFPSGGASTKQKVDEAAWLVDAGVEDVDIMIGVGRLRSGDRDYVQQELQEIASVLDSRVPFKVILEVGYLSNEQIRAGCEMALAVGAAYVKTGSGWSGVPTNVEHIRLIRDVVGDHAAIKASGGIRSLDTVLTMSALGVQRFGIGLASATQILLEAQTVAGDRIAVGETTHQSSS